MVRQEAFKRPELAQHPNVVAAAVPTIVAAKQPTLAYNRYYINKHIRNNKKLRCYLQDLRQRFIVYSDA